MKNTVKNFKEGDRVKVLYQNNSDPFPPRLIGEEGQIIRIGRGKITACFSEFSFSPWHFEPDSLENLTRGHEEGKEEEKGSPYKVGDWVKVDGVEEAQKIIKEEYSLFVLDRLQGPYPDESFDKSFIERHATKQEIIDAIFERLKAKGFEEGMPLDGIDTHNRHDYKDNIWDGELDKDWIHYDSEKDQLSCYSVVLWENGWMPEVPERKKTMGPYEVRYEAAKYYWPAIITIGCADIGFQRFLELAETLRDFRNGNMVDNKDLNKVQLSDIIDFYEQHFKG